MPRHERFQWSRAKAESNRKKHGVSFEVAAQALADEFAEIFHKERYDDGHGEQESRWITLCLRAHPAVDRAAYRLDDSCR